MSHGKKILKIGFLFAVWILILFAGFAPTIAGFDSTNEPRSKTSEEVEITRAIERAYELYFREVSISGKKLQLRVPFGQQNERFPGQDIFGGGKATPWEAWVEIEKILDSEEFGQYIEALSRPGKKLIFLNLPQKKVEIIFDKEKIEIMKARFLGKETFPCEMREDAGFSEIDVYNYLYTKGVGVDCSGFSFFILRYLAFQYDVDLCQELGLRPVYIGTWIYNYWNTEEVDDRIINLRPGDVILFHCWNRPVCHSLVIGSIDFSKGEVTYYQCTDWVLHREERGPHLSKIFFDPAFPEKRLSDPEVVWEQKLGEIFPGEGCPYQGKTDGYRYLIRGGGRIVRFKILTNLIRRRESFYYSN